MKQVLFLALVLMSSALLAQGTVNWIGGTPGKETAWNEPRNWDNNRVPDETTHVVIQLKNTGHFAQPVIDEYVEVASLTLYPGGELNITDEGTLLVDGGFTLSEGIRMEGGKLNSAGEIVLLNLDQEIVDNFTLIALNHNIQFSSSRDIAVSPLDSGWY